MAVFLKISDLQKLTQKYLSHEKTLLVSMKSWLFNRDPYNSHIYPKQPGFVHCSSGRFGTTFRSRIMAAVSPTPLEPRPVVLMAKGASRDRCYSGKDGKSTSCKNGCDHLFFVFWVFLTCKLKVCKAVPVRRQVNRSQFKDLNFQVPTVFITKRSICDFPQEGSPTSST